MGPCDLYLPTKPVGRPCIHRLKAAAVVLLFAAVVFSPIVRAPFLFDDLTVIGTDPAIANVRFGAADSVEVSQGLWVFPRPVRQFSHRLDAAIAGPDNAMYAHAVNIALHFGVGLLFFLLLRRLGVCPSTSFAALALFLVHPVCIESVGIVSHRKEMLSALFLLLSLHSLLSPGSLAIPAYAATLFLGIFSKETAAVAPLLFLVVSVGRCREEGSGPLSRRKALSRFAIASALAGLFVFLLSLDRFAEALPAFRAADAAGADSPAFQRGFAEACKRNLLWREAVARYRRAAAGSPAFRGDYERHRLLVEDPPLATAAPLDAIVLGDGVPHGTGSFGPDGREHSLAERLSSKCPGLCVRDASVPDSTAYETNRDFLSLLSSSNAPARICIIMAGHNDAFAGRPPAGILFELSGCIFQARQNGMRPVVVGPIRVESAGGCDCSAQEGTLCRLDALLASFCADACVPFLSPRNRFLDGPPPPGGWLDPATGNHLTEFGMDRLADLCLPFIAPSIRKGLRKP